MCCFAGGEVSCLPEFESIIRLLNKYDMFYIFNSSCVEYEKSIEKYLKYGSAMLIVSVDSGTRELHNKIKQVDTYDCVWKNIAKYSHYAKRKELIYTKYIVLKDINDNETAIEAFLTKSKEAGIKYVLMEIDHYYFLENRDNIPKYIIDLFYYAFNKAKEMDLICEIYSNSSVLLLQGKWADEFWHPHVFDTSKKIEALTKIYKITKELYYTKYDNIISAASQNHLSYKDVLKSCKKNSCGKKCKINNDYYFYAKDIEINSSVNNDNVKLDWVKINSIIGFLKYKKLK